MKNWWEKLANGETVYLAYDDFVARLIPGTEFTLVKQLDGKAYSIKDTTNLATDFRVHGKEITEEEYNYFGKK